MVMKRLHPNLERFIIDSRQHDDSVDDAKVTQETLSEKAR
jgi:hypothetical protein